MGTSKTGRLTPPAPSSAVITRTRLFALLDRRPTVVVAGTAGYGKSMLISSWLERSRPADTVAWLTLDTADQDASRLTADLLAALRSSAPDPLAGALRGLRAPALFADPLALVDSLHEALNDNDVAVTVVLDDVQHLAPSSRSLEVLDHFLQWAPSRTRVVLSGRTVPSLRLQRLRLEDRLELIGHRELAFTWDETAEAVAAAGLELSGGETAALHHVTQGWPAGVRMAVLAMNAGAGHDLPLELRRDDSLADYLTTEVLASIDPQLRRFVLEATVDELVCPSLVDAVRGGGAAAPLLERCLSDGLFLTREDDSDDGPWYRWHALFAAHMRSRRLLEDAAGARELDLAASRWWSSRDTTHAVRHALAAGDPELAGRTVAASWLALVLEGRADTVHSLVAQIPAGVAEVAELHLALALVAAQRGQTETARHELGNARHEAGRLDATARARFEIRAAVIDVFLVDDHAALTEAVAAGLRLLQGVDEGPWAPDRATVALVQLYVGIGEARLQDDVPAALQLLRAAEATARQAGFTAVELAARAEQCIPAITEGDLEGIRAEATRVLDTARAQGWADLPSLAPAHAFLGWLSLWKGDAARARTHLDRTLSMLLPTDLGLRGLATTVHLQTCLAVGDLDGAEADARRGHELAGLGLMPPWWQPLVTTLEATVAVARGDLARALDLVRQPVAGPEHSLATGLRASVLLRAGRPLESLAVIDALRSDRMLAHVAPLVAAVRAQALLETGKPAEAHAALELALTHASRYDFVEPFLLVGDVLGQLLRDHLDRGTSSPELVVRVLDRLASSGGSSVNAWGETLTEREQKILRYLATNLSNAEIAEAEFISVNTTKTHVAHVYRKLEVSSRRAAVRRAAELGLI